MQDYRKLNVWQKAHRLAIVVYATTESFPSKETYGLTSQLRRAASSIPANIAEGCGRGGRAEFTRFLRIAMGSANEVQYYFLLARDLKLLDGQVHATMDQQIDELMRMLSSLIKKTRTDSPKLDQASSPVCEP